MSVFEFEDYRTFVRSRVKSMPHGGRGEFRKIADHLRMHSTRLSQIFSGTMNLTVEQAFSLTVYFGLNPQETRYFILLVETERAGTEELREFLRNQVEQLRARSEEQITRVAAERLLNDEQNAVFYSHWHYRTIHLLSSIKKFQTVDALASHLKIKREQIRKILDFLLEVGLCKEENGRIVTGPQRTHLDSDSPLLARQQSTWRLKAIERHDYFSEREFSYTGPMTISESDQLKIQGQIGDLIAQASRTAMSSEAEKLVCLNIDWFEV